MGEFGGLCNSRTLSSHNIIAAGHVRCADGSPNPTPSPPSPSSTHTSSTVSQTTSTTSSSASTSRQAPVLFPPISGGSANWALHRELNCWDGHGARSLPNSNPLLGTYTVEGCREQCEMNLECEAAVIAKHVSTPKFPCFLRTILQISQCRDYADFDVWEIRRTTVTASTTSRSTVVTSATSTTTSITSSASSTSSSSSGTDQVFTCLCWIQHILSLLNSPGAFIVIAFVTLTTPSFFPLVHQTFRRLCSR